MNSVVSFYDKQLGNHFQRNYDVALQKLRCLKLDEYTIRHDNGEGPAPPILACKFAKAAGNQHIIALANEDGAIAIQNVNTEVKTNAYPEIDGKTSHLNAIFDLAWKYDDMKLVTASGDHTLRSWTITESDIREDRLFVGHDRSVKTVTFQRNGSSVFASGGRDSCIYIWDTRAAPRTEFTLKADKIINCSQLSIPKTAKKKGKYGWWYPSLMNSITGLEFQDDNTLISCCASDGTIRCWDMRKSYSAHNRMPISKHSLPYMGSSSTRRGYTNLLVDHSAVRLYASCLDNVIYCYNISTYSKNPVMTYVGHQIRNSFYVKTSLSPDSSYLLSGSVDEKAYIWNVRKQKPLLTLKGHAAEVTCVAWCQSGELILVTCSDDAKHKIWRVRDDETWKNDIIGSVEPVVCKTPKSEQKRLSEDESSPYNKKCRLSAQPSSARKRLLTEQQFQSPNKRSRSLFQDENSSDVNSLATILEGNNLGECSKEGDLSSQLTANLPNFVVDGTAPHLRIISPQKQKQNKDWISQIRKEKEIRCRMIEETTGAGPSSPKYQRLDSSELRLNNSPKNIKTPSRKSSRKPSLDTPPRAQSPLSRFFKITASTSANSNVKDMHCASSSISSNQVCTKHIL